MNTIVGNRCGFIGRLMSGDGLNSRSSGLGALLEHLSALVATLASGPLAAVLLVLVKVVSLSSLREERQSKRKVSQGEPSVREDTTDQCNSR